MVSDKRDGGKREGRGAGEGHLYIRRLEFLRIKHLIAFGGGWGGEGALIRRNLRA